MPVAVRRRTRPASRPHVHVLEAQPLGTHPKTFIGAYAKRTAHYDAREMIS